MAEYTIDKIEYGGNVYNFDIPKIHIDSNAYSIVGFNKTAIDGISGVAITYDNGTDSSIFLPDGVGFNTGSQAIISQIPTITLNGAANTSPSFYAPTTAGTNGYYLKSNGSGAPTWSSIATTDEKLAIESITANTTYYPIMGDINNISASKRQYDSNGLTYKRTSTTATLTLGNKTTGSAHRDGEIIFCGGTSGRAVRLSYSSTNTSAVTLGIYLPDASGTLALNDVVTAGSSTTNGGLMSQADKTKLDGIATGATANTITLNGSAITSPSFYAPTTAGTNGYVLKSNGSGAPTWTSATLTDTKVTTEALTSGTMYYPILATGTGTATRQIDSTLEGLRYESIAGTTSTAGSASLVLGNHIAEGTANNEDGQLVLYGPSGKYGMIVCNSTANRIVELPDQTGTLATTKDIYESVELTQLEYDALSTTDKTDPKKVYFVKDADPSEASELLDMFYPIGSYYETTDPDFNPNSTWGGYWESEEITDDGIVEEGASGIWTYRKWKSGICEAFGTKASEAYPINTASGSCYYVSSTTSIPSGLFISIKSATAEKLGGSGLVFVSITGAATNQLSYYVCCSSKGSVTMYIMHTVYGYWKTYEAPTTIYKWKRIS